MVRHLRKTLELIEGIPHSADVHSLETEALSLVLATGIRAGGMEDGELFIERANELAQSSGDPLVRARLEYGIGSHFLYTNRFESAVGRLRDAATFADTAGNSDLKVASRWSLGVCHWFMGSLSDACSSMEAALELVSREPHSSTANMGYDPEVALLSFLGLIRAIGGDCRQAAAMADRAVELAQERDAASRVLAYAWAAWGAIYSGDRERSLSSGQRGFELAEQVSAHNIRSIAMVGLGGSVPQVAALTIPWGQPRVGSSPTSGTTSNKTRRRIDSPMIRDRSA
jgi:hypothetical protein